VRSTFRLAETTRRDVVIYVEVFLQDVPVTPPPPASTAPVAKAGEALGRVEEEVAFVDDSRKPEEVLDQRHLAGRVRDQSFSADEVESFQGEVTQPAVEVTRVQSDLHRSPRSVDDRRRRGRITAIGHKRQLVERSSKFWPLGHRLRKLKQ